MYRYPKEFSNEYAGAVMFSLTGSQSTQTDAPTPPTEDVQNASEEGGDNTPSAEESRQEGESFAGAAPENQSTAATTVDVDRDDEDFNGPADIDEIVVTASLSNRVLLYLPPGLQYRDNVVYDTVDLGLLGAAAERGAGAALRGMGSGGIGGMASNIMSEGAASVGSLINSIRQAASSNLQTDVARYGMSQLATMIPNAGVQGAVRGQLGVTSNPNTRVLFNKVNLREFAFTFKLIARSEAEANEIQAIVKFFRKNLYPETFPVGGIEGLGYKFPQKFEIYIDYGGDWEAPKIKDSYLRDVNTTMNASTMAILPNGTPLEVDLSLSFVESAALDRAEVEAGY
jgi:hypothetical protein